MLIFEKTQVKNHQIAGRLSLAPQQALCGMLSSLPAGAFMHEMLLYVLGEPFSSPGLYTSVYEVPVLTTKQVKDESVRPS